MVLLYSESSHRSWKGFITILGQYNSTLLREIDPRKNNRGEEANILFSTRIKEVKFDFIFPFYFYCLMFFFINLTSNFNPVLFSSFKKEKFNVSRLPPGRRIKE